MTLEKATFAAGCFWHVEAAFRKIRGIIWTQVGYTGGHTENPTYEQVCTSTTGHAEAVTLEYDPAIISYPDLLNLFWSIHDPTSLNHQGPDIGTQYRSAVFYHTPQQQSQAIASRNAISNSGKYQKRIVTEIVPAGRFWQAEEHHQRYFEKHGSQSCRMK